MNYAEVAVNSPGSRSTFCYVIPLGLNISAGQAVWVPFGSRVIQGIVIRLSDEPSVEETKEIAGIVSDLPLLSTIQMKLAQWISEYYFASLFDALALMLPPGFERRAINTGAKANLSYYWR
jgi:primosomal protein N' (replication factor Y)